MKIIGHRGASGYYPENTLTSFKKAIEQKADGIELDVHLSKDDYMIVCHDEAVDRTTNGTGFIKDMTYSELLKLDAGYWFNEKFAGEKIPTLNEVFDLMRNNDMLINIELKCGSKYYPGIEEKVLKLISSYNYNERVIVSSFDHYALITCKEINPNIKTGVLYGENLVEPWEYAEKLKADTLHPNYITVDKNLVLNAKLHNLMVNPYTVNDPKIAKQLSLIGVNLIITNYPDICLEVLNK